MTEHGIDKTKDPLRYVVLAGNLREYQNWCTDNNVRPHEALFAATSQVLRGRRFQPPTEYVIIGSFDYRSDAQEILSTVQERFFF